MTVMQQGSDTPHAACHWLQLQPTWDKKMASLALLAAILFRRARPRCSSAQASCTGMPKE